MTGSQSCIDCIGGKFQDLSGQSISKKCGVGKFTTDNRQTGCVQCSAGLYNDEQGQTSCKACLAGTFQSNTGQQLCSQCIAGQYISDLGNSKCLQCPLSRYSDETGANICSKCPVAKYQDTEGAINCKFCFEVGQAPNKAQTACINPTYKVKSSCKDTEYLDNADPDRDNHVCRTCPAGASCIGWIDWSEVVGIFGWARCPARSGAASGTDVMTTTSKTREMKGPNATVTIIRPEIFQRCQFSAACLGKPNKDIERRYILSPNISRVEQCSEGYLNSSRLCYACAPGYSHAGDLTGRCNKCPVKEENIAVGITAGIMGCIGLCLYLYITLSDGKYNK